MNRIPIIIVFLCKYLHTGGFLFEVKLKQLGRVMIAKILEVKHIVYNIE